MTEMQPTGVKESGFKSRIPFIHRRQPEIQASGSLGPWEPIAEKMRETNIGGFVAAERAFSLALLNRLINRSQAILPLYDNKSVVSSSDQDRGQDINGARTMATLPYETKLTAQNNLTHQLFTDYQTFPTRQTEQAVDPDATVALYPASIGPEIWDAIKEDRQKIFNQVAEFSSDVELAEFDKKTVKAQRKLRRKLPDVHAIVDEALPSSSEIKKTLPENKKTIAEMDFNAALVSTLLRDTQRNVDHDVLKRRPEDAVWEELHGLITQYDRIKDEKGMEPPQEGTSEAAFYQRVKELEPELDQKRDNIYRRAALIPNNDIAEFEKGAESAVHMLSHRRLRGEQRELLAERTNLTVEQIEMAYKEAFKQNRNLILRENGLALVAGVVTATLLRQFPHISQTAMESTTGISEAIQDTAFLVGGSSIAKLIVETGQSISVVGSALHDTVAARTDNIFLRKGAANIGQAATQTAIEKIGWGTLLTIAAVAGLSVRDALAVAIGANALGVGWQGYLSLKARRMRRRAIEEGRNRHKVSADDSSDSVPAHVIPAAASADAVRDGSHEALPDQKLEHA